MIGVGWTLGVIFGFYCLFPFFVYLLWSKKRAWFSLAISLGIYYVCSYYFTVDGVAIGCNVARWLSYFIVGGIIFLYRNEIENIFKKAKFVRWLALILVIGITVAWFFIPSKIGVVHIEVFKTMIMFSSWLIYSISVKSVVLANPITKFLSNISFEIYLAHMLVFRIVEKVKLTNLFESGVLSYIFTSFVVLIGVIAFAFVTKLVIDKIEKLISKKSSEKKLDE